MDVYRRKKDGVDAGGEEFKEGLIGIGRRTVGGDYEGYGKVMVEGKTFGELSEGNEVTQSWSWKYDDVRLKMTSFFLFCWFHGDFIKYCVE